MVNKYEYRSCVLDIETDGELWTGGKIVTISIMDVRLKKIYCFFSDTEELTLIEFLQFFNKNNYNHIIGYNINFDRRYIFAKCMAFRLSATKFFKAKTTDLMIILKGINGGYNFNRPGKLSEWLKIIGKENPYKSAPIPVLAQQKKYEEIKEYNMGHVQAIHDLWKSINFVLEV